MFEKLIHRALDLLLKGIAAVGMILAVYIFGAILWSIASVIL